MWGGPEFRFPFTLDTFREDLRLHLPSYSVVGDTGEFLGFGQYYVRVGRCHLARLAISPSHRGQAFGAFLIRELCRIGCGDLNANECSLFVMDSNAPALKLYRRLGFVDTQYPGDKPSLAGVIYMVVSFESLVTERR
jgi:ribosomal protein S18 acetylase RimI-like enzyme